MKYVIKRDGRRKKFDKEKIKEAILKAFVAVDGTVNDYALLKAQNIADYIDSLETEHPLTVEEIQDLVENGLMACKRKDVAREYILYREERNRVRLNNTELIKRVKDKLAAKNVVNQNANVDEYSFGGRKGEADSEMMKQIALDYIVSKMAKQNHLNNEVYIHDLDAYAVGMHNCLSIPFDDLLAKGFNTRQTDVRPAGSINTAFQLVAVIFQLQSLQQFGGVSATHLDWTLVPYVRKSLMKHYILEYLKDTEEFFTLNLEDISEDELDKWISDNKEKYLTQLNLTNDDFYMGSEKLNKKLYQKALLETRKETYQAAEGMYHNLNTLQSRSGNQLPFTSINYGTCTLPEGRMIIKAILEGSLKGVGKHHKTPIFPCGIFQYWKGINDKPGTPNYDLKLLAIKSTAQRLYPNYANVDWSNNAGYDRNDPKTYFSTMGKRKLQLIV